MARVKPAGPTGPGGGGERRGLGTRSVGIAVVILDGDSCLPGHGFDLPDDRAAVGGSEALEDTKTAPQTNLLGGLREIGRSDGAALDADDLIGRDAQCLGELGEQWHGGRAALGLVVGDHPLGEADLLAELVLGETAGDTEAAQASTGGFWV